MEPSTRDELPVEPGSDRSFGLVFSIAFLVIGVLPLLRHNNIRHWAIGLSGAFLLTALASPRLLNPLNRAWTRFGLLLNRIVSPVALLIVYCVAIVPTAMILRLLRKDLLSLKPTAGAGSYWIARTPPARPDDQMRQQF